MANPETFDIPIGKVVGRKGNTGNGIESIELLSTSGLNKTYRITMTDETTFNFVVTDGNGISGASFDAQTNAMTLTFDNGTSFTTPSLKGTKGDTGNGISKIEKTGTAGLVDTYTVTYTDGQTYTYTVTNGADGVSPEVTVTPISGGHTVEIEDADGVKTFDVLDGEVTEARLAEALADKAPAILETASGAIASFDDGADSMPIKKLVAKIEPVQDLHGYANPWPGGGNVNIGNFVMNKGVNTSGTIDPTSGRAATVDPIQIEDGKSYYVKAVGTNPKVIIAVWNGDTLVRRTAGILLDTALDVSGGTDLYVCVYENTASDQLVGIDENQLMVVTDNSVTTYSPYANDCPISGHTGAEIKQIGANIWDEEWEIGAINGINGQIISNSNKIRSKNYIPIQPNTTYYFYHLPITGSSDLFMYRSDKTYLGYHNYGVQVATSFTTPADAYFMRFSMTGTTYENNISVNYPATDTTYHPYTGNQISVNWEDEAGTVYGGTLTLNPDRTGTLVVDMEFKEYDGTSDEEWIKEGSGSSSYFRIPIGEMNLVVSNFIISNLYAQKTITLLTEIIGINVVNSTAYSIAQISVRPQNISTMTIGDFRTQLATTPLQVVYKLVSPQTIQLTAEQVSGILETIYGTNNILANTGDVTVEYPADTKLYIEKLTQPTEDDMTADHAISAGTFFQLGNTLYIATAAIATGATITPGTNATKLSLADALNQLNS